MTGEPAVARGRLHAIAAGFALAFVVLCLWLLPAYGPTWDPVLGELPHGERILNYQETGDPGYLDVNAAEPRPLVRQPHPEFAVGGFALHQISAPLSALLSAIACRVFWTELGWLPALEAHQLPSIAAAALLCYGIIVVLGARLGLVAGLGAATLLVSAPRFLAHVLTNIKDAPQACIYPAAVFACFVAMQRHTARAWALAGAATAFALAAKVNALFVPWQALAIWLACLLVPATRRARTLRIDLHFVAVAAATFLATYYAISPDLWRHPIDMTAARFGEVFRVGNAFTDAGAEVSLQRSVSMHGLVHVLWTTPPLVLALALAGILHPRLRPEERVFLIAGLAVPIGRTLLPGMRNFDGVRHFLEFFPFMAVAAGVGIHALVGLAAAAAPRARPALAAALFAVAVVPSIVATARLHPNGVCYFNVLSGGLGAQQAAGNAEATDYWANSYWQGLDWLEKHAAPDARLVVPVAGFVVRAAAPLALRADLTYVPDDESPPFDRVTYAMYVTRGQLDPFVRVVDRTLEPVYTIDVQGGTILKIYRLDPDDADDVHAYGVRAQRHSEAAEQAMQRLGVWINANRDQLQLLDLLLQGLRTEHRDEARARLRELLPRDAFDDATFDALVWRFETK